MAMYWWADAYSKLLLESGDYLLLENGDRIITEDSTVGASWRLTTDLSVYDGSWKNVLNCWIWNGSAWKVCYIDNAMSLSSFSVLNLGGGTLRFSWTFSGSRPQDWRIYIDKSSNSGSTWSSVGNYSVTTSPQSVSSLSATDWYRCRLAFASDTSYQATSSPITKQPPYPT